MKPAWQKYSYPSRLPSKICQQAQHFAVHFFLGGTWEILFINLIVGHSNMFLNYIHIKELGEFYDILTHIWGLDIERLLTQATLEMFI